MSSSTDASLQSRAPALAAWIAFALTLPLDLMTMSRSIGFVDRGELAAAATTFGIAHATGYPTLMLLGGLLTRVVPLPPVLVLNALTATLTAAGTALLVLLFDLVLARVDRALAARTRAALALLAALVVATTTTWWQQANGFEVYALHQVMMPLVVLLFLRWLDAVDAGDPRGERRASWALALVLGLAFTNHMTTLLLVPALAVVTVMRLGMGAVLWRRVAALAPGFLLGLLPYAWLPIRSRMHPLHDWGGTSTLSGFLHHVTGGDYRRWMFSGPASMAQQARHLAWQLPSDFLWIGLLVAGLGAALLVGRRPALAALALLLLAAGVVYPIGYSIPDVDSYLLTAVLGLGLLFAVGLLRVRERCGARITLIAAATLALAGGVLHWRDCDESGNGLAKAFVSDLIGPLPQDAVLVCGLWDIAYSGSLYAQEVEGLRPDVVVIDPNLARRSWYLDQLDRTHSALFRHSSAAFHAYRDTLRALERGGPRFDARIEAARAAFFDAAVDGWMRERPVFSTGALWELRRSWRRVPWHLAVWIRADSSDVPETPWRSAFRPWRGRLDVCAVRCARAWAEARLERSLYEARAGRARAADSLFRDARRFDPGLDPTRIPPMPVAVEGELLEAARFFRGLAALEARGGLAALDARRVARP